MSIRISKFWSNDQRSLAATGNSLYMHTRNGCVYVCRLGREKAQEMIEAGVVSGS